MFRESLLGKFTTASLAAFLGDTSLRTVQRWYSADQAPRAVVLLLNVLQGDVGIIHPHWQGWTIDKNGKLWSPEGRHFEDGELRALQYQYARIRALNQKIKSLEDTAHADGLEGVSLDGQHAAAKTGTD